MDERMETQSEKNWDRVRLEAKSYTVCVSIVHFLKYKTHKTSPNILLPGFPAETQNGEVIE